VVANDVPQRTIFCIKDNLRKFLHLGDDPRLLHPRTRLFTLINQYVNRARDITIRISMLDHLHTLRMCEEEDTVEHDANYYVKLARAVCGRLDDIQDEQLRASCEVFQESFPDHLDYTNMSVFMSELAVSSVQNFNEHLSRNIQAIVCRLLGLEMSLDPDFFDESTVIRKLALHIYKLLSNQVTVWPYSVEITDIRVRQCSRLIEKYFPWFQFLSMSEDAADFRDFDYNPDRDEVENEQENDVDNEIDADIDEEELEGLLNDADQPLPQQQQQEEEEQVSYESYLLKFLDSFC